MLTMMSRMKDAALGAYVKLLSPEARRIQAGDLRGVRRSVPRTDEVHVRAALHWLCRAHDIGVDDGISAMYSLVEGWQASYPETTGYLIPTLFDCAARFGDATLCARAVEAADWLRRRQHQDGSFAGGFADRPGPARVFNTGQVLFGLIRASQESAAERFLNAAARAGRWLVARQDADGAWRRATLGEFPHAYNARTGWALVRLAEATGEERFRQAGVKAAKWTLAQQIGDGWVQSNAFERGAAAATLHSIAYAVRGLLEVGASVRREDLLEGAVKAASALDRIWREHHHMSGAYRRNWDAAGRWRCLPGEAQLAIIWMRLDRIGWTRAFLNSAWDLLEDVKAAQMVDETDMDLYGGVSGSVPIHAPYERYCLVSWGAKFLIDALNLKENRTREYVSI